MDTRIGGGWNSFRNRVHWLAFVFAELNLRALLSEWINFWYGSSGNRSWWGRVVDKTHLGSYLVEDFVISSVENPLSATSMIVPVLSCMILNSLMNKITYNLLWAVVLCVTPSSHQPLVSPTVLSKVHSMSIGIKRLERKRETVVHLRSMLSLHESLASFPSVLLWYSV
jgi:hypothetical protein